MMTHEQLRNLPNGTIIRSNEGGGRYVVTRDFYGTMILVPITSYVTNVNPAMFTHEVELMLRCECGNMDTIQVPVLTKLPCSAGCGKLMSVIGIYNVPMK